VLYEKMNDTVMINIGLVLFPIIFRVKHMSFLNYVFFLGEP